MSVNKAVDKLARHAILEGERRGHEKFHPATKRGVQHAIIFCAEGLSNHIFGRNNFLLQDSSLGVQTLQGII